MAITLRGEKTYLVRVYLGRDQITKKRLEISETVHGDLEEAEKHEQLLKNKARKGELVDSSRMTVKGLVELYLNITRRHRSKTSQYALRKQLERYVLPYIGSLQIAKIKTSDIQRLWDFLLDPKKEEGDAKNK